MQAEACIFAAIFLQIPQFAELVASCRFNRGDPTRLIDLGVLPLGEKRSIRVASLAHVSCPYSCVHTRTCEDEMGDGSVTELLLFMTPCCDQETQMLEPGTSAPDWTAPDQSGNDVSLGDLRGKWVAMWWYPKASTPG